MIRLMNALAGSTLTAMLVLTPGPAGGTSAASPLVSGDGCQNCPDIDGDGNVGILDLLQMLAAHGVCPEDDDCPADINCDKRVDVQDLLAIISNWGPSACLP